MLKSAASAASDPGAPGNAQRPAEPKAGAAPRRNRIVCIAFGTRGDVQPVCLLARALTLQGHSVTLITSSDYHSLARSLGVKASIPDVDFESAIRFHRFNDIYYDKSTSPLKKIAMMREVARDIEDRIADLLFYSLRMVRHFDLVVYNPFAFFAGQIAQELNIPSVRVVCQPLFPTRHMTLSAFGGGDRGAVVNRLSYETLRGVGFLMRHAFRSFRAASGTGRRMGAFTNPLTLGLDFSAQISAFSPHLAPDPSPHAAASTATGFWFNEPLPDEALPNEVMAFLHNGEPAIYIGFGSMFWGARRNTEMVTKALSLWGGRAIIATGTGSLKPIAPSPNIMMINSAKHALLFPHVAGAVHHGGAGTTAQSLKCGLPTVILPVLGDQFYWGKRVAALGAGPAPVPLRRIEPETLAQHFAESATNPAYRSAARELAAILSREPGIPAAVARIEQCLEEATQRRLSASQHSRERRAAAARPAKETA